MSRPWIRATVEGNRVNLSLPDGGNISLSLIEQQLALVSIYGAPRSAKSSLLNYLRGTSDFQTLSGDVQPCTVGVDLSRPISLSQYAGYSRQQSGIMIAFADVEGAGDKNANYDMCIFSALLLVSLAVLYNWKGGLSKREIMDTLESLAIIARQFSSERLGVLYFVMRDTDSSPEEVYSKIFTMDGSAADESRRAILAAFSQVRVFCLSFPTTNFADVRKPDFGIAHCSPAFRAQIATIKESLILDCSGPRILQGIPLNGVMMARTVADVVRAINSNDVDVFPRNRAEMIVEHIVRAKLRQAANQVDRSLTQHVVGVCDPDRVIPLVMRDWTALLTQTQAVLDSYPRAIVTPLHDTFANNQRTKLSVAETTLRAQIMAHLNVAMDDVRRSCTTWLMEVKASIPATTLADLEQQCVRFRAECVSIFRNACRGSGLEDSWRIVTTARASLCELLDNACEKLHAAYLEEHRKKTWAETIAGRIYNRAVSSDIITDFVCFRLQDAAINDTNHHLLRSVDIARPLWDRPFPAGQTEETQVANLMRDIRVLRNVYEEDPSMEKKLTLVKKGLAALQDEAFLNAPSNYGSGAIPTRTTLAKIYNVIQSHSQKSNLLVALCEELYHAYPPGYDAGTDIDHRDHGCPGGVAARLFNALRGFYSLPGLPMNPGWSDAFGWAFSHRVLPLPTLQERLDEANVVLDEYGIILAEEREVWLEAVRARVRDEQSAAAESS